MTFDEMVEAGAKAAWEVHWPMVKWGSYRVSAEERSLYRIKSKASLDAAGIPALLARVRTLEAANSWKTIESAPKDGTEILGWDGTEIRMVAWLDGSLTRRKGLYEWAVPESWQDEQGGYASTNPTHWMPLPPPPASAALAAPKP